MFRFANHRQSLAPLAGPSRRSSRSAVAAREPPARRLARFGNPGILEGADARGLDRTRGLPKFILFCIAVTLLVLAAARPQFGSRAPRGEGPGIEMMLTVDVSNSM
ncbi:MAG: hypothetical protein ACLUQ6_07420, partial [Alistipes onderdonkii]